MKPNLKRWHSKPYQIIALWEGLAEATWFIQFLFIITPAVSGSPGGGLPGRGRPANKRARALDFYMQEGDVMHWVLFFFFLRTFFFLPPR